MQKTESHCEHCPNNPNPKKPFVKMTHVKLDSFSHKRIEEDGLKPDCLVCETIEDFLKVLV